MFNLGKSISVHFSSETISIVPATFNIDEDANLIFDGDQFSCLRDWQIFLMRQWIDFQVCFSWHDNDDFRVSAARWRSLRWFDIVSRKLSEEKVKWNVMMIIIAGENVRGQMTSSLEQQLWDDHLRSRTCDKCLSNTSRLSTRAVWQWGKWNRDVDEEKNKFADDYEFRSVSRKEPLLLFKLRRKPHRYLFSTIEYSAVRSLMIKWVCWWSRWRREQQNKSTNEGTKMRMRSFLSCWASIISSLSSKTRALSPSNFSRRHKSFNDVLRSLALLLLRRCALRPPERENERKIAKRILSLSPSLPRRYLLYKLNLTRHFSIFTLRSRWQLIASEAEI